MNCLDLKPFVGDLLLTAASNARIGSKPDGSDAEPFVGMRLSTDKEKRYLFFDGPLNIGGTWKQLP